MTALCPRRNASIAPFLFLVLLLAVVALASAHAVIRHGQAAINAQSCFNGAGQTMRQVMVDPLSGRKMSFCNQQGHWFVSIDASGGDNVTMFPRSFARCLADVVDYAKRSGFTNLILH